MNEQKKEFCFSTLAFGSRYRLMAKQIAKDLDKYGVGVSLVVGTDRPSDFKECKNTITFKLNQQGILHCYHDKRFVIEHALSMYNTTIQIDADTNITGYVPEKIINLPGLIGGHHENLIAHVTKYTPERLKRLEKVAAKIAVNLEEAKFIGESLLIISRDRGKEKDFINYWGTIGKYLELRGIHAGSGNIIGLAALKVGWKAEQTSDWQAIKSITQHFDASHQIKRSTWENWQLRFAYHYRLNKTRMQALGDFDFYYR